jgi:hypothetical protein
VAPLELGAKEIAEQMVVAVPLPMAVQGNDERVGAREGLQRISCVIDAEHGVAQRGRHPVEDRRPEQELLKR